MSTKRGRPVSTDTTDPVILQRRRRTAERVRQLRERRRLVAATAQQSEQQAQRAEAIAERPFEEADVEQTLPALGLRVQGMALDQDAGDAQLQQDAVNVEEHDELYSEGESFTEHAQPGHSRGTSSTRTGSNRDGQQTFPLRGPFSTASTPASAGRSRFSSVTIMPDSGRSEGGEDDHDHDSNEEASVHSFASEHSEHTDDGTAEVPAHEYVIQKLYEQLQGGFHGCSEEQHTEQLNRHMAAAGENHHGLNEVFNDPNFPSVLELSTIISADSLGRRPLPTPAQWQAMFCGVPEGGHQRTPMNVCLHKEETQAIEPQVAFDIDSFLGFASSLAMARQGLWYMPAPKMTHNIRNDVHIRTETFDDGDEPSSLDDDDDDGEARPHSSSLDMLKDVPHFLLGRVVGGHDITMHVLFPHLVKAHDKFICLTNDQLSRWLDKIFHPAVYRYCDAHYTQHLPSSYRHSLANSKAHQVEGRQVETSSYRMRLAIGYHLQPEYLGQIWSDILDTIANTPGLGDFREPLLFFSAKGTKLQFKTSPSRPTLLDAMENFEAYFERLVDLDFVYQDRFYVDIGKEICANISLLPSQQRQFGDEPQVYCWKRCCLREYMRWMYDRRPPAVNSEGQRYYHTNMLGDAVTLTSVTPKRSKHRAGGLIYSQFYGSVKELSDAEKCMPFDNDGLEELALDPQIRQGACHAAGGRRRDAKIIEQAYCAGKRRTRNALEDSRKKSFGIREEHRVSWSLFQGLRDRLRSEDREELEVVLVDCPSYAWAVRTETYMHYLWRSADKFAAGFEVMRARCQQDLVTWEQTKMMAMFLRCLRFVFAGGQLQVDSALWWSRRERWVGEPPRYRLWYGLGFCNTLARYKYCWLEPRVDWNRLTFRSQVTDNVLFGNNMLRGQYLRRGGSVQDFFGATRRLELALEWMEQHHGRIRIRTQLIHWMVHICLQQFRADVLSSVKSEIVYEHREEALQGGKPFCHSYLSEIFGRDVYLMSGNRCDFKKPEWLGRFLFGFDDGMARTHWENKPYRKLYRRGVTGLKVQHDGGLDLVGKFERRLQRLLFKFHWILPYPCAEVLTQTTKQGQRMWYSIQPAEGETSVDRVWEWARKDWMEGRPEEIPEYVSWSKERWDEWIETN